MKIHLFASAVITGAAATGAFAQCSSSAAADSPTITNASWQERGSARRDIVDTAVNAGSFNTLAAALKAAGLVDALKSDGPFTVFAPTDEAFAKLPAGTVENLLKPENRAALQAILKYHVVSGKVLASDVAGLDHAETLNGQRVSISSSYGVRVNNARVTSTDIQASNGVIHVIDTVIMPSMEDVVDVAVGAGQFTTLAAALDAAQLISTLKGDGPFTVFAPTDAAFAKLPAGTVENLLKPENRDKLRAVLTYHVVPGRVYADQALEAGSARTVQGSEVRIRTGARGAYVNDARITSTDIQANNGVIHVIDSVILPPGM